MSIAGLPLTAREKEILLLVSWGKTNAEIGRELFIELNTVKTHLERIRERLGTRNRAHAVGFAYRSGLLQ